MFRYVFDTWFEVFDFFFQIHISPFFPLREGDTLNLFFFFFKFKLNPQLILFKSLLKSSNVELKRLKIFLLIFVLTIWTTTIHTLSPLLLSSLPSFFNLHLLLSTSFSTHVTQPPLNFVDDVFLFSLFS